MWGFPVSYLLLLVFVYWNFVSYCVSQPVSPWFYPVWDSQTLCASWTWVTISFPMLGRFLTNFFKVFSSYFFLFLSSGIPIIQVLVSLMWSKGSLILSSFLFILFSLFCSMVVISTILSYSSLTYSSFSVILLLMPSSVFFMSVMFFIIICSLFLLGPC